MSTLPIIPESKNYWLVRTNGGRYYNEFRSRGFVAIGWDEITIEDVTELSSNELTTKIRTNYPDKKQPGRASAQLRTFVNHLKQGDTVVITGVASSKFSIGEIVEDDPFTKYTSSEEIEGDPKICPYSKRKRVRWLKDFKKWEVDLPMFKLLQHAQNTISDANSYKDVIEGMIHNFFIRGDSAYLGLQVKTEHNIPMHTFFSLGNEIISLAEDFNSFSEEYKINIDAIDTKININSPGNMKFIGPVTSILAIGAIVVGIAGGGITVPLPEVPGVYAGGDLVLHTDGVLHAVSDFLDAQQVREHKDRLLKEHMEHLDIDTPEELNTLMKSIELDSPYSKDDTSSDE